MTLIGQIRTARYSAPMRAVSGIYAAPYDPEIQLALWNDEWRRVRVQVPYFAALAAARKLPERFSSWAEFAECLPPMSRATIQEQSTALVSTERPPDLYKLTGGSTAQPVRLPKWRDEGGQAVYERWMARGWYGITPDSRVLLLWGHSHLLGKGLKGWANARKREILDRLVGCCRLSAYDIHPDALRRAAEVMLRFRPDYVVGYSVALDLLARANADRRAELRALGMRGVIATAESFPAPDSAQLIEDTFGCPAAMEYGAAEAPLIAHTRPQGGYAILWRSYFVEAEWQEELGAHKVRLTSLYPRAMPLVRYELGDLLDLGPSASRHALGLDALQRVVGRQNDAVQLPDGSRVHSVVFTHAVRSCPKVLSYQVVQRAGTARVEYTGLELAEADLAGIRERLSRIHPSLADVPVVRVGALKQTVAGKVQIVRTEA